jgi:chemotaxis protein methyltransferase CheR
LLAHLIENTHFKPPFHILSIPTSSGEEPYSLAIVLTEVLGSVPFDIVGCDIDLNMVEKAKRGVYGERSISKLPKPYIEKYFTKTGDEYHICQSIKNKVRFYQGSITDRAFVRSLGMFHYVFCKNLFIYFDDESKEKSVNNLYDITIDQGYLFLGHAESLSKTTSLFEPVKLEGTIIYRKQDD